MLFKQGATRNVFLTKNYAIKIPRMIEWKLFLCGLLANMQEVQFWKVFHHEKLCPVLWSLSGGLLIVMPRTHPLTWNDYGQFNYEQFIDAGDWVIPVEDKQDSFGWYEGRIVAIDYGT